MQVELKILTLFLILLGQVFVNYHHLVMSGLKLKELLLWLLTVKVTSILSLHKIEIQLVQSGMHGKLNGLVQQLPQVVDVENIGLLILDNQEVVRFFKEQLQLQLIDKQDKVLTPMLFLVLTENHKVIE